VQQGDSELGHLLLEFGRDLREARRRARLTQAQVAERLGQSQSYVSMVERGQRNLSFSAMLAFARAVGFDLTVSFRPARRPSQE
jgi:transcriptional regulator with XRE-family HTH domain